MNKFKFLLNTDVNLRLKDSTSPKRWTKNDAFGYQSKVEYDILTCNILRKTKLLQKCNEANKGSYDKDKNKKCKARLNNRYSLRYYIFT